MCQYACMEPEGLRERKKRQRRRRIEEVALDLFEQRGFGDTTIDDIAEAADIAPRTFFSYFSTKEDVVLADYAGRLERIIDHLDVCRVDESPWSALRSAFASVAADYETERPALVRRFEIMAANPSVQARSLQLQVGWEESVGGALRARIGDLGDLGDLDARLTAAAALAAMRSAMGHWMATGHGAPLPILFEACFDRLGAGLGHLETDGPGNEAAPVTGGYA